MSGQAGKPTIRPRRSKGSVVSQTYEFPYMRQAEKKTLGQLIYDRQQGKILGRTPRNCCELLAFYTIFYIALAALFAICMKSLLVTIDMEAPKWKLGESLIGTNPGLGFRPISDDVDHGSLIWYDASNQTQIKYWTNILDKFMKEYIHPSSNNQKTCDFDTVLNPNQVCKLDTNKLGKCSPGQAYGYNNSAPCIFLKLNRIYGWEPEYFNDPNDLPEDMPQDLVSHIKNLPEKQRNQVWVSCQGESPADLEILGEIEYFPSRGFPSYYYPYTNNKGYLSPLVAVKFLRPYPNQIINIECRAWAKNIIYVGSHRDRQGSVHFELMIDAPLN